MQNRQRLLIDLIVLDIIVSFFANVLSDFTYAQENLDLHKKTLYEITKFIPSKQNAYIPVGNQPSAIGIDYITHKVYVVNMIDDTVSVIDGINNTKIGKDIPVGSLPSAIGVDYITHKVYVADDNTVSAINTGNNKIVKVIYHVCIEAPSMFTVCSKPCTFIRYKENLGSYT